MHLQAPITRHRSQRDYSVLKSGGTRTQAARKSLRSFWRGSQWGAKLADFERFSRSNASTSRMTASIYQSRLITIGETSSAETDFRSRGIRTGTIASLRYRADTGELASK